MPEQDRKHSLVGTADDLPPSFDDGGGAGTAAFAPAVPFRSRALRTFGNGSTDDIGFVEEMVNVGGTEACVDPDRVFVTGFSMGGCLRLLRSHRTHHDQGRAL